VAEIAYRNGTIDGVMRHPKALGLREDPGLREDKAPRHVKPGHPVSVER
jgi:ATP-dependent DNA ligase